MFVKASYPNNNIERFYSSIFVDVFFVHVQYLRGILSIRIHLLSADILPVGATDIYKCTVVLYVLCICFYRLMFIFSLFFFLSWLSFWSIFKNKINDIFSFGIFHFFPYFFFFFKPWKTECRAFYTHTCLLSKAVGSYLDVSFRLYSLARTF